MSFRFLVAAIAAFVALTLVGSANAHTPKHSKTVLTNLDARKTFQLKVIKHDLQVVRFFKHHRWLFRSSVHRLIAAREARFHGAQLRWTRRELRETMASIRARERARILAATDWRTYLLRLVGRDVYNGCALPLIGRESGGGVTKWNYGGSGAYGLGQALPASKMAPYGSDYMTNGVTQIKWMHAYVNRYGGWCAANAYQASHGSY